MAPTNQQSDHQQKELPHELIINGVRYARVERYIPPAHQLPVTQAITMDELAQHNRETLRQLVKREGWHTQ